MFVTRVDCGLVLVLLDVLNVFVCAVECHVLFAGGNCLSCVAWLLSFVVCCLLCGACCLVCVGCALFVVVRRLLFVVRC